MCVYGEVQRRVTGGITEALHADALDQRSLAAINSYSPGLSGSWLFQKAMSVEMGAHPSNDLINKYVTITKVAVKCLYVRFQCMKGKTKI